MKLKDIDIHNLPLWLSSVCEAWERECENELKKESDFYNRVLEESSKLLEKHRFISTLIDQDEITEPMLLTTDETRALSKFLALDTD